MDSLLCMEGRVPNVGVIRDLDVDCFTQQCLSRLNHNESYSVALLLSEIGGLALHTVLRDLFDRRRVGLFQTNNKYGAIVPVPAHQLQQSGVPVTIFPTPLHGGDITNCPPAQSLTAIAIFGPLVDFTLQDYV